VLVTACTAAVGDLTPRRRSRDWSTATRLTAAAAVVTALVLAAGSAGTVLALRHTLLSALDRNAHDEALDLAERYAPPASRAPAVEFKPPEPDAVVQVVGPDGSIVLTSEEKLRRPVVPVGRHVRVPSVTAVGRLPIPESADAYHVAAVPATQGATVLVALPSDDVTDAVHQLTVVLSVGLPALFVLLVALSWVIVGRALVPVEQMQRRQRAFAADAAHELRTPLASLRAQLETSEPGDDRAQLVREVSRMTRLVDALLALARVDDHRLSLGDVDLDDLVFTVVRRHRQEGRVNIDVSGVRAVRIRGDAPALELLVDNLVANAVRHARSTVVVTLAVEREAAALAVADDGPGIAVEDRARAFERFTRLEPARSRTDGGVGLGLAIVKAVADAHGGVVAVLDNDPGARINVRVPTAGAWR
jgi:signal transduction histidine kinase